MLDDDADESLHRTEDGPVEHDGALLFALFINVGNVESFGKIHVELDRSALPEPVHRIPEDEIKLRSIESAVPGIEFEFLAGFPASIGEGLLGFFPCLNRADVFVFRSG